MTPRGPDDHETGDLPDPPYSAEILADLHADALPDRTAAHIRTRIVDDVAAQSILAALDHTSDDLRSAGPAPAPVPDQVRADVATTLAALGRDPAPVDISAARRGRRPARSRSRDDRRMAGRLLLAAAAVVIVAVGTVGILRLVSAPDATNPGQTPRAQSTSVPPSSVPAPAGPAGIATALSVLGRTDGAPFGSVEALRRCTAAHLVPVEVVIVGSGRILVDGTGAAAILLSTGEAGRFDALIVGLDCDLGNPALISRGIVGG